MPVLAHAVPFLCRGGFDNSGYQWRDYTLSRRCARGCPRGIPREREPGDTPRKAALREMAEEAGYTAKKIKLIHKKSPSNTLLWDIYIYAAKNLKYVGAKPERGEMITDVKFIPFAKTVEMALDGTIENEFISYNIIRFGQMLKNKEFKW